MGYACERSRGLGSWNCGSMNDLFVDCTVTIAQNWKENRLKDAPRNGEDDLL